MPDRRADSGFEPMKYAWWKNDMYFSKNAAASVIASMHTIRVETPNTFQFCTIALNAIGKFDSVDELMIISPTPLNAIHVPIVAIIGSTLSRTTMKPLSAPIAMPVSSPPKMHTGIGRPAFSISPQTNAEQPMFEPTEKSVLPAISETVRNAPMIMSVAM